MNAAVEICLPDTSRPIHVLTKYFCKTGYDLTWFGKQKKIVFK